MIEGVYFCRKDGEVVIGTPLPAFDDLFLQIDSDNTSAGLYFVVEFLNIDNNKKVSIKLYPKIGYNEVETYISQILRNFFNEYFIHYTLLTTAKEYDESGYVGSTSVQFFVIPSIYNSFLPPLKNYYFYYYNGADYDILSSRGITLYDDDFNELSDEISITTTLNNIYKETLDPPFKKIITITHKQVCEPLWKIQYLNLHTGYYDRFSGWYLKQDTKQVTRQTYNRLVVGDTGMRQSLINLDDEFTLISYDLPVDQANYIAKSIIMSPKTYLIDTNETQVECVVQDNSYQDAVSVVNTFSNIKLKIKI